MQLAPTWVTSHTEPDGNEASSRDFTRASSVATSLDAAGESPGSLHPAVTPTSTMRQLVIVLASMVGRGSPGRHRSFANSLIGATSLAPPSGCASNPPRLGRE